MRNLTIGQTVKVTNPHDCAGAVGDILIVDRLYLFNEVHGQEARGTNLATGRTVLLWADEVSELTDLEWLGTLADWSEVLFAMNPDRLASEIAKSSAPEWADRCRDYRRPYTYTQGLWAWSYDIDTWGIDVCGMTAEQMLADAAANGMHLVR